MELRKLKVTRTGNRSTVTKKTEKYEGFEEFSRENLLLVYKDLKQKRKLMENLDEQILDQTTEEEEIENEIIVTDEYNTELDIRLRRFIEFTDNKFANVTGEKQDFLKSNDENGHSILMKSMKCHLITQKFLLYVIITLCQCRQVVYLLLSTTNYRSYPYLRSTETNWQSFWDSFNSGVHNNISLSDVQKFNYLNSLLVGEALSVEEGLAHTNVNYIKAIDLLNERYRQPHKITRIYMHALLDLLNRLIPYTV